jgi:hypothetical protein
LGRIINFSTCLELDEKLPCDADIGGHLEEFQISFCLYGSANLAALLSWQSAIGCMS